MLADYNSRFYNLIVRYKDVIKLITFGFEHTDSFRIIKVQKFFLFAITFLIVVNFEVYLGMLKTFTHESKWHSNTEIYKSRGLVVGKQKMILLLPSFTLATGCILNNRRSSSKNLPSKLSIFSPFAM